MTALEIYNQEAVDEAGNVRKVIKWNDHLCQQWVLLYSLKCAVERTPSCHEPANIIGLNL